MKVLIVDGSKERRRALADVLAELNTIVVQGAVADVRTALRAVVDVTPDVVITDVTLPDGDGTFLIDRVRKMQRIPAVIVTTHRTTEEQRLHYLAAGADRYVDGRDPRNVRDAVVQVAQTRLAAGSIPIHETQRLLGRLTAGIVHDFNNYLHAADVSLELIERQGPKDELLASVRAAVEAMHRLNTTLLAYARGGVPTTGPLDVGNVVNETVATIRRMIPSSIAVNIDIAPGGRPIVAVRSELEQLVLNLIVNACDAMPCGGQLDVLVRPCTPRAVMLTVADTGHGIDAVKGAGASTKHAGAGLGLNIVRTVVAQQGASLRIAPREPNGTMISIMLPTVQSRVA